MRSSSILEEGFSVYMNHTDHPDQLRLHNMYQIERREMCKDSPWFLFMFHGSRVSL